MELKKRYNQTDVNLCSDFIHNNCGHKVYVVRVLYRTSLWKCSDNKIAYNLNRQIIIFGCRSTNIYYKKRHYAKVAPENQPKDTAI